MAEFTKQESFFIAENDLGGELYLFLDAKNSAPKTPKIIYDGRDHALFYRNEKSKIILDYIHPDVREKLRKSKEIMVVETLLENISDAYMVSLEIVEKIPLNLSEYDLMSWEELSAKQKA